MEHVPQKFYLCVKVESREFIHPALSAWPGASLGVMGILVSLVCPEPGTPKATLRPRGVDPGRSAGEDAVHVYYHPPFYLIEGGKKKRGRKEKVPKKQRDREGDQI